jgi:molecular chaperone HscB
MRVAAESPSRSEFIDPAADYFAVLGLPRAYDVERDAIEDAYLALSKRVHPDRFAGADSGTRRRAVESTSLLNQAYRTVKDRVKRAEYLCKVGGVDLDSSDAGGAPKMDQMFLMEMIERREKVEGLRTQGADTLDQYREEVEDEAADVLRSAVAHLGKQELDQASRALVARRYLARLLDEIDGTPH